MVSLVKLSVRKQKSPKNKRKSALKFWIFISFPNHRFIRQNILRKLSQVLNIFRAYKSPCSSICRTVQYVELLPSGLCHWKKTTYRLSASWTNKQLAIIILGSFLPNNNIQGFVYGSCKASYVIFVYHFLKITIKKKKHIAGFSPVGRSQRSLTSLVYKSDFTFLQFLEVFDISLHTCHAFFCF